MASTNGDSDSGGSQSPAGSGSRSVVEFVKSPIGMAVLGGFLAAIVAGYFII